MFKSNIEKLRAQVEAFYWLSQPKHSSRLWTLQSSYSALIFLFWRLYGFECPIYVGPSTYTVYIMHLGDHRFYAKINDPVLGPPGVRILLTFCGLTGYIGIFGSYYSLQYLPLADAVALAFLIPLFTAILGALLLKEKFGIKEVSGAMISLIGAILIARPPFLFGTTGHHRELEGRGQETIGEHEVTPHQRIVAVGVALLGVVGFAIQYTLIRVIGKRAHPLHNTTYLAMLSVAASTISMLVMRTSITVPSKWSVAGLLLFVSIFGMISQTLVTMGYQREAVGRASMDVYTGMVFALVLGKVVFGTVPGITSFAGTAMILGSSLYIALTKPKGEDKAGEKGSFGMSEGEDVEVRLLERREDGEPASA